MTATTAPYLLTRSGIRIDLLAPRPVDVTLPDIAHALARICRYTGHCDPFYSVAQHSVLVASLLESQGHGRAIQAQGLLHDAHEAYTGDVASPIKRALREIGFSGPPLLRMDPDGGIVAHVLGDPWTDFEARHARAVRLRFGLPTASLSPAVHAADLAMLMAEARDLMPADPGPAGGWPDVEPAPMRVYPLAPPAASALFLEWAERLWVT